MQTSGKSFFIILFTFIFLLACSISSSAFFGFLKVLPEEKEIELGELYLPASLDEFEGTYPEEKIQEYLQTIGQRIAKNSNRKMPYQFHLVNSEVVNAFALPGGPVVITRGIFLTLEEEDELAGILAHEIGHIEKRHHAKFIEKQLAMSLLLQIGSLFLPQNLSGELLFQLGRVSAGLLSLKFSRDQEREADEAGFILLLKTGYSPEGMLKVFERFKKVEKKRPLEWISTHPLPESRIKDWQERMETLKPSGTFIKGSSRFIEIKNILLSTQPSFEECQKGKKAFGEKDFEQAEKHFLKAIELYPKNIPALIYLAKLNLREKNYSSARDFAFQALKFNPELFSAHYLCGLSEFALNNYERSVAYFEKAKKIIPFEGSSYYYAGRNYEKLGNLQKAKINYQKALEIGPKNAPWYEDCYRRYQRLR